MSTEDGDGDFRPSQPTKKSAGWLVGVVVWCAEIFTIIGVRTKLSIGNCLLVVGAGVTVGLVVAAYKYWDDWQYARKAAKRDH